MAISVIHTTQTTQSNNASKDVSATAWNAEHTVSGIQAATIDWENPVAINTSTSLTISKHNVISDLSSPANYTVTLPAASGNSGKLISIEIASTVTKLITVDGNSAETIDGELTRVLWARETAILLCNGSSWTKIAGKTIPMSASLKRNASLSISSGATTLVTLDSSLFNIGSIYDDTGVTIKRAGKYIVNMFINNNTSTVSTMQGHIYINGSSNHNTPYSTNIAYSKITRSNIIDLAAGDIIRLYSYSSASVSDVSASSMSIMEEPIW